MTWEEFCAARQVLVEEQMGIAVRFAQRVEQAQADKLAHEIRRQGTP